MVLWVPIGGQGRDKVIIKHEIRRRQMALFLTVRLVVLFLFLCAIGKGRLAQKVTARRKSGENVFAEVGSMSLIVLNELLAP